MKPGIDQHLMALTGVLATKIAPALPTDSYAVGDVKMAAALLIMLTQEVDRRADTLWRENKDMCKIFQDASQYPLPDDLRARLSTDAATGDTSLRISALETNHAALSQTLIALHTMVEDAGTGWAAAINARIWDLLERGAEDRILVMPAM
jgi:hypothetical protein